MSDNKKTIIILPGWGGTYEMWKPFLNYANSKNEYEFICMELPCFGQKKCPDEVWGVPEYAGYVKEEISKLGIENLIILGHSFGGQVASYLIAKTPGLVTKLILSGAPLIRPRKTIKRLGFYVITKIGKVTFKLPILNRFSYLAKKVIYKITGSQDYNLSTNMQKEIFKKVIRQDLKHLLPEIKLPTLVLWGKKDTYVPWRLGKKIAARLPNSEFVLFAEGKHGLHLKLPEEFYQAISRFLKS